MASYQQPSHRASGLRILLVEDDVMVALLIEDMLAELGHEIVGPATRLGKATELAQHEALDAAILDVNINGQEVYPVAELLAARSIPFIFCTGYGRGSLREPYRDRPALQKPFRQRDLQELVATVCRARHSS